jgi:hypothetical protein
MKPCEPLREPDLQVVPAMERNPVGPLSFSFPAGLILGAGTVLLWVLYAAITRAAVPSCELLPRTAWSFATGAAGSAFLLPFTYIEQRWLRLAVALAGAAMAAAAAFWATASLFPQFC